MDANIHETSKGKSVPSKCTICGASALYKYFGAISCHACKIFFKRNAQIGLAAFHCITNGNCEINIYNRHICTFCRLTKCFSSGMQIELIRCPRKHNTRKSITTNQSDFTHISIHSELNVDQRNLLLNLSQYYEEWNILSHIQQFIHEQISLPIKVRYKNASLDPLFRSVINGIELFFKKNDNFHSLCSHDHSNLLRCIMKNAGCFTIALIVREIPLFDYSDLTESILIKHLPNEIAHDRTFIQLGVAMFIFSSINHADYSDTDYDYIKDILRIQNFYAEITWKYLVYKYDHTKTVICFIHLIKSFVIINQAISKIHEIEQYKQMIDNLIEKINSQIK